MPISYGQNKSLNKPWVLCLGAGINFPYLPDWKTLTYRVASAAFGDKITPDLFNDLCAKNSWSLDVWLQAAANKFGDSKGRRGEFAGLLGDEIYKPLLQAAQKSGILSATKQAMRDPYHLTESDFNIMSPFLRTQMSGTSALNLAQALCEAAADKLMPSAIINFNADVVFECLLKIELKLAAIKKAGAWCDPKQLFYRVVRAHHNEGRERQFIICMDAYCQNHPILICLDMHRIDWYSWKMLIQN